MPRRQPTIEERHGDPVAVRAWADERLAELNRIEGIQVLPGPYLWPQPDGTMLARIPYVTVAASPAGESDGE